MRALLQVPEPPFVAPIVAYDLPPSPLLAPLLADIKPLIGSAAAAYLEGRGLPADFCKAAGVRFSHDYFGRPAVVFPLRDASRSVVALHGRYTDGRTDPKSRTKGPMVQAAFATPGAWSGDPWGGRVVITEAPIDALTLAYCGVPAVALCGTSGGKELLKSRLVLGQAVAAFDNDTDSVENAGMKAGNWLAGLLAPIGCQVFRLVPPDGTKDWNEALLRLGVDALRDYLTAELSAVSLVVAPLPAEVSTVSNVTVETADTEKGDVGKVPTSFFVAPPGPLCLRATGEFPQLPPKCPADLADLLPLAAEVEAAADAIRHAAIHKLLDDARANALPIVSVALGPGRTSTNPNLTARSLFANFQRATGNPQPTADRPHPWGNWHGLALTALEDLETLAFWWQGMN